jgi:hypothetical protein
LWNGTDAGVGALWAKRLDAARVRARQSDFIMSDSGLFS